jgi:hypothetical protein
MSDNLTAPTETEEHTCTTIDPARGNCGWFGAQHIIRLRSARYAQYLAEKASDAAALTALQHWCGLET